VDNLGGVIDLIPTLSYYPFLGPVTFFCQTLEVFKGDLRCSIDLALKEGLG
jgi:hypothetical protein